MNYCLKSSVQSFFKLVDETINSSDYNFKLRSDGTRPYSSGLVSSAGITNSSFYDTQ